MTERGWPWIGLSIILAMGLLVQAGEGRRVDGSAPGPKIDREVCFGGYSCLVYESGESVSLYLYLDGTPGVSMPDELRILGGFESSSPVEACEEHAAAFRDMAESLGCAAGSVRTVDHPTTQGRSFNFVCQGDRDPVVRAMGSLGEEIVTAD
jgi:hypothetical protein